MGPGSSGPGRAPLLSLYALSLRVGFQETLSFTGLTALIEDDFVDKAYEDGFAAV